MAHRRTESAFTIIEVVLVLAIAGLIFLMVFIALPALQAAQRDTERKNDVAIIASAIIEYKKNNRGKAPPSSGRDTDTEHTYDDDERRGSSWASEKDSAALRRYLVDLDPGGVTTSVGVVNFTDGTAQSGNRYTVGDNDVEGYVTIFVGAKCPDMNAGNTTITIPKTNVPGDIVIIRYLERGYWYCHEVSN